MSDEFPSLYAAAAPAHSSGGAAAEGSHPASTASSSSSAAQALEQMHQRAEMDGAGEASTSSTSSSPAAPGRKTQSQLDLSSESAFPSLGAPSAPVGRQTAGGWGANAAAARSRTVAAAAQPTAQSSLHTEALTLPSSSINIGATSSSNRPGGQSSSSSSNVSEPTTLGGVLNYLGQKFPGVKIEASTSTAKQTTTFLFKAQRQNDIERVKQELRSRIIKKVNETIQVPSSTRAFIIGAKGKTLKSITEETGVNIQIPRDQPATTAGTANVADDGDAMYDDQDDAEPGDPLIAVHLYGDVASVNLAKQRIQAIVSERTSRLSTKVTTIPTELYHLLSAKVTRNELVSASDAENVNISIPPVWKFRSGAGRGASASTSNGDDTHEQREDKDNTAITVSGEREAVGRAVDALVGAADELRRTTQKISVTLSKRQHRFILPPASDEILLATSCSVEIPPASNPSDQVTIRGASAQIVQALQLVMEKANAAAVDVIDLATVHGINTPPTYSKQCARYLLSKARLRKIADEEGVQIYIPRTSDPHTTIDIVATSGPHGPAAAVANGRAKILEVLKGLPPNVFEVVEVDQLLHRFLIGRKGSRIQSFEEKNQVQVVFPPAAVGQVEDKAITLVYVGSDYSAAPKVLAEVKEEILKLAKDAADISTVTLSIPAKLHKYIIGPSGTTLNALIGTGDDRLVNVRFGSSSSTSVPAGTKAANGDAAGAARNEDEVVIRGPSDEVKKAAKEMERIAEEAKNDEIVNSHVAEFEIEQRYVSHIVGKGGAGVQKLREELGVRIDFAEGAAASAAAASSDSKSKKSVSKKEAPGSSKSHVKIQGRKENVEEAKRRVLKQVEQLADETTLSIPMPAGVERGSLIGKQGAYVQRLESKYDVRINFPRANAEDGERDDAITIRGGKKGAEGAKKELVELMDYEKEHNQSTTLSAPARALPRIFGRQGAAIRELQQDTGAEIDVTRTEPNNPNSPGSITIRGTKQAIASAKKALSAIITEIQDEAVYEISIERALHVTIIGKGGQNIRDLVTRCGGPSDSRAAGALVRFPRAGDDTSDVVTIRGPKAVATKIRDELQKEAAALRDRIVYGVVIPQAAHARLVGRGGAGVNEMQRKHNVRIVLPGWTESKSSGEPVNGSELGEDVSETDLIKILGSRSDCEAAAAELKEKAASAPAGGSGARQGRQQNQQSQQNDSIVQTVMVPANLHTRVTQGGKFFRTLPNGIKIDHGDVKPPSNTAATSSTPSSNAAAKAARIDEEEGEESEFGWEVTPLSSTSAQDNGEEIPWNIRGNDQEKVERVEAMIKSALERTKTETHKGVLTVPQSLVPRIVGRQGSGLDRLRALGVSAEVEGRQGANSVIFLGTPDNLEKAREAVIELNQQRNARS